MKTTQVIISLLALATLATGCNEKIAPALNDGATIYDPTAPVTNGTSLYFRLVNNSDTFLNYQLHKTGLGNFASKCEIHPTSDTETFSVANYQANPANYDITCFLEAEELALYFNGVDWSVEASPNICEYISYTPYSFYQWQPGSSTRTLTLDTCTDDVVPPISSGRTCNAYYNGASVVSDIIDTSNVCRFDYSSIGGPNCDEGIVNVVTTPYTFDSDAGVNVRGPTSVAQVTCGGDRTNCINGPIRKFRTDVNVFSEATRTELGVAFSKQYTVDSPWDLNYSTNVYASNYSRQCSGVNYTYDAYGLPSDGFTAGDTGFNPQIMELLSKNIKRDFDHTASSPLTSLINYSSAIPTRFSAVNDTPKALALAPNSGKSNTAPYYYFHCMDKAMDVKARIRVVIREWDRNFDPLSLALGGTQLLDLLSDVYAGSDARLDNNYDETGNFDFFDSYNDIRDIDDMIGDVDSDGVMDTGYLFEEPVDPTTPACQLPKNHGTNAFSSEMFPEDRL